MNARSPIAATLLAMMFWPTLALGQQRPAGIVTTLEGTVTATRASLPHPLPLKFKDEVFLNDRITTGDRSIARVLLGGRALVTVRERSALTITEIPGRSTINLESGKIALAVAKDRMRPGESIDVRTPNAVAGIRGTVVVVDVSQATAQTGSPVAGAVTTSISTLTGTVAVTFLGPLGQTLGSVSVGPNMFSTLTGLSGTPRTGIMTPEMRAAALAGLQASIKTSGAANADQVKEQITNATTAVVNLLAGNAPLNLLPPPPAPLQRTADDSWTQTGENLVGPKNVLASPPPAPPPTTGIPTTLLINDLAGHLSPAINTNTQPPTVNPNPFLALEGDPSTAALTIPAGQAPVNVPAGQSDGALFHVAAGDTVDLARPLLGTASAVTIAGSLANVEGTLSLASSTPTVQLAGTTLTVGNNVARVAGDHATMDVNGTFLRGTGASITTGTIAASMAVTDGGTLIQTGTGPLIELRTGTSFVSGGAVLVETGGGHVSLSDSLLRATDSNLTVGGGLVLVEDGSDLTMNGTNPLVVLSGGGHTIGNNTTSAMFQIAGRAGGFVADTDTDPNTDDPTNLTFGADRPVRGHASGPIAAPLLDLQRSANASLVGNASAISIDTALLEATAPLIRMTNATMRLGEGSVRGDVVKLVQHAKLTANVPNDALVSLSAGNLTAGNLVALGAGTRLNVIGDLLRLANNSTATLTSLLNLSGNSVASINGALVRFLGTGNVLNINNFLTPTAMVGDVPVHYPGGNFNVSVGYTALVGLGSAGVIKINGIGFDPAEVLRTGKLPSGSLVVIPGTGSVRVGPPRNGS